MKAVIEQKSSAPVDQQTLYFQEQVMHNDSVLSSISGLDHGGMVYLSRRHFSLTIYSWLTGSLEKVQLKLNYNIMVMVWVESVVVLACAREHVVGDCWSHDDEQNVQLSMFTVCMGVVMCCIRYSWIASKNCFIPVVLSNGMLLNCNSVQCM